MTQDDDKEKAEAPYSMRRPQMENFLQTEKNPFVNYEVKRQSSVKRQLISQQQVPDASLV